MFIDFNIEIFKYKILWFDKKLTIYKSRNKGKWRQNLTGNTTGKIINSRKKVYTKSGIIMILPALKKCHWISVCVHINQYVFINLYFLHNLFSHLHSLKYNVHLYVDSKSAV